MENQVRPQSGTPAETLERLLGDPALLQRMRDVLSPLLSPAKTAEMPQSDRNTEEDSPFQKQPNIPSPVPFEGSLENPRIPTDPIGNLFDEETLRQLPQMLETVRPLLSAFRLDSPSGHGEERSPASREHLLLALKPFLSPNRRNAVDSILRISRLGEILKQLT